MPPAFHHIETPRLTIRRFRDEDLPAFLAYRNDPEVARYQSWESVTEEDGRNLILEQRFLQPGAPGRWFQFAVESRESGRLVGDCALHVNRDSPPQGEVGYTLSREHQRKGYGQEMVGAVLDYAFRTLLLHRVTARLDVLNDRSVLLLERLGFRREGHYLRNAWFKGRWTDEYLYAVLREEWLTAIRPKR